MVVKRKATLKKRILTSLLILIVVSLLLSCVGKEDIVGLKESGSSEVKAEGTKISAILANSSSYHGRAVTVVGKASGGRAFQFVNEQPYRVDDGTGEIWVVTSGIVPQEDSTVAVTGRVEAPYQIKGRRYEVALIESQRRE